MPELVLHVAEIDEDGKDYAFELKSDWLDASLRDASLRADPAYGPGSLEVHAQKNGTEYLVTGKLRAHLLAECGRCLGDAKVPVDVVIGTLFARTSGRALPPVLELEESDLQREEYSGNEIKLEGLVREHLVLEVPMQPLCSDDCTGIPVPENVRPPEDVFAGGGNVDPRLAPLKNLRDKVPAQPDSKQPDPAQPESAQPKSTKRDPKQIK
jgi:uncharacterized protein